MLQFLNDNPMLIFCALAAGVIVSCTLIVFVTDYLRSSHQAEIDAELKHEMLSRGMTAEDIKTVLESRTDGEAARLALTGSQGIRVGLGNFHVKLGNLDKSKSSPVST